MTRARIRHRRVRADGSRGLRSLRQVVSPAGWPQSPVLGVGVRDLVVEDEAHARLEVLVKARNASAFCSLVEPSPKRPQTKTVLYGRGRSSSCIV